MKTGTNKGLVQDYKGFSQGFLQNPGKPGTHKDFNKGLQSAFWLHLTEPMVCFTGK